MNHASREMIIATIPSTIVSLLLCIVLSIIEQLNPLILDIEIITKPNHINL